MAILSSDQVKMTSVLEKIVAIIAPHRCIVCGNYNNIVCGSCIKTLPAIMQSFCVLCGAEGGGSEQICKRCAPDTKLDAIWVRSIYDGPMKDLIYRFKFEHARDAYRPVAKAISATLPSLEKDWLVVPVPTVAAHIRERSYDHMKLVAKQVARLQGLPFAQVMERTQNVRQVGATRAGRAAIASSIALRRRVEGKRILLIDDVCTTGATLKACALLLADAGATGVAAAVAAWQPPSSHTKKDR